MVPFPASLGKVSWRYRRMSRGGTVNRKVERNSRGGATILKDTKCLSPVQSNLISLHCLDCQCRTGNYLSCSKGVKDPFNDQEGRCDFPRDAAGEKGLISPGGENLLVFVELWQIPLELERGPQGPARVASGKATLHPSCEGSLGIPLQCVPGLKSLSGAEAGI